MSAKKKLALVRTCCECGGPATFGDSVSGIYACDNCLGDADSLFNLSWAPPSYLVSMLTRGVYPQWNGLSMERRTAALRATLTAHQLLVAASALTGTVVLTGHASPAAFNPPSTDELVRFVNRVHFAASNRTNGLHVGRMDTIDTISRSDGNDEEIESDLARLRADYPELQIDEVLFRSAVLGWVKGETAGRWKAVGDLLKANPRSLKRQFRAWRKRHPVIQEGETDEAFMKRRKKTDAERLDDWLSTASPTGLPMRDTMTRNFRINYDTGDLARMREDFDIWLRDDLQKWKERQSLDHERGSEKSPRGRTPQVPRGR